MDVALWCLGADFLTKIPLIDRLKAVKDFWLFENKNERAGI